MATPETNATFDTSCKTGLKILDYLLSTDVEDSSRFEGKGLNPSFIASSNVLIFLETTRAGLFVGTTGGKGFAIAKVGGSWSAPCYVSLRKFELGAILGFSSSYTIISGLSRRAVQEIIDDNYTEFGTDVTIQLWPKEAGIDDSVAVRLFLVREITLQDYKPIRKQVTLEASQAGFDASKVARGVGKFAGVLHLFLTHQPLTLWLSISRISSGQYKRLCQRQLQQWGPVRLFTEWRCPSYRPGEKFGGLWRGWVGLKHPERGDAQTERDGSIVSEDQQHLEVRAQLTFLFDVVVIVTGTPHMVLSEALPVPAPGHDPPGRRPLFEGAHSIRHTSHAVMFGLFLFFVLTCLVVLVA